MSSNDLVKFNAIIGELESKIVELAELGRDGFKVPLVTTPDELAEMVGASMGPWRPLSNNLIWFYALKTTLYARQMLAEAGRIFEQMDDEASAQKMAAILQTVDEQFRPCETSLQVYGRLLGRPAHNGRAGGSPH